MGEFSLQGTVQRRRQLLHQSAGPGKAWFFSESKRHRLREQTPNAFHVALVAWKKAWNVLHMLGPIFEPRVDDWGLDA